MMAISAAGQVVGSVAGGCIEDDLIQQRAQCIQQGLAQEAPQRLRYGIKASEAHSCGLPCGGVIDLLVECSPSVALLQQLLDAIENGRSIEKRVCLNTRSEEHTSELQSRGHLVCRLLLEKRKKKII